ncbi:hypothetical protein CBR_g18904 [Chara braunii]|uniref:Peptidase A2 domain-containing protein n=1 Tax=Chara braunii TaxID=69332 RepID=A0A388KWQ7_CHABU|nr:hypothetical protein CBR_g18904 [Chara braunii]|eukprot:GBG74494.1 hypothetical protein CBR_g18904 [Chara braunii]
MEEVARSSEPQAKPEAEEPEKVYGKPREEEPEDKATAAKKKFRYPIPILTLLELDDTISKLLGTMVSVSFQTMLQASPRLLKGLKQLLTRRRVEIGDNPELPEGEREEEAPQEVANLQRSHGDLEDLERVFADIRLNLPDREGGEVTRSPPGTKLSFHALPVGKLKIQIGSHHTDALVDGGAEITLIRRDFATITGCTVNKEVTGSIRGAGGEIPFAGYVMKCVVKAGVRESIWSFQRMIVMEEMDHDIILGRPWCANVEMIGMHLHDGSYMVDIEDPVTDRGELLRLLGTGGDPPKGKLATWSPSFEDSTRKGAFARMEVVLSQTEKLKKWNKEYTSEFTTITQIAKGKAPLVTESAKTTRRTLRNIRPLIAARYVVKVQEWQIATDVSFKIPHLVEGSNVIKALRDKVTTETPMGVFETVPLEEGQTDPIIQEDSKSSQKRMGDVGRNSPRAFSPLIVKMAVEVQLRSGMIWKPWRTVTKVPYSILADIGISAELAAAVVAHIVSRGLLEGDEELDARAYATDWERFYRSDASDNDCNSWDGDDERENLDLSPELEKDKSGNEGLDGPDVSGTVSPSLSGDNGPKTYQRGTGEGMDTEGTPPP